MTKIFTWIKFTTSVQISPVLLVLMMYVCVLVLFDLSTCFHVGVYVHQHNRDTEYSVTARILPGAFL